MNINKDDMIKLGWFYIDENGEPPHNVPILVFGYCCEICHNIRIAEIEDDNWYEAYSGEDLTFMPEYWMPLPLPKYLLP
jgi:hypothetical protein